MKLRTLLGEGIDDQRGSLSKAVLAKIYTATDENNHNEARLILATAIDKENDNDELGVGYRTLIANQDFKNEMTDKLLKKRRELDKKLFSAADYQYTNYKDIKKAF